MQVLLFSSVSCSCKGKGKLKGKQICEGGVTKELKTLVKICTEGKLKLKPKSEVKPGYPLAGGGEEIETEGEIENNQLKLFQNVFGMERCFVMELWCRSVDRGN